MDLNEFKWIQMDEFEWIQLNLKAFKCIQKNLNELEWI